MSKKVKTHHCIVLHAVLLLGSFLFLVPLFAMISTSLKTEQQTMLVDTWGHVMIPEPFVWKNYLNALEYVNLISCFKNSFHVTILTIIGSLFSCTIVSYSFARLRWPGRDTIFLIVIATMMLPAQVTMVPVFLIFAKIGWVNTLKPLWIGSFFGTAFFIFLLRQFFMTIPTDIEEAAKIDGCGYVRTLVQVMVPLIKPALLSVIIFQFMWTWNDFLGPLIYIQSRELMTLTLGLQAFTYAHSGQWHYLMAGSVMMTLPVLILFFALQRYFIEGITLTGIKG
jgi:multiple sugar transport system permease protein